tara:strand:+ start:1717 stop:1926 length:210 start_codon:yes stop_codon:yes gene_type:complete
MKDYLNDGEYSEFQVILDKEFEKAQKLDVDKAFDETLKVIRKLARQLNDDDCYNYTEKMKKWFNKEWGI